MLASVRAALYAIENFPSLERPASCASCRFRATTSRSSSSSCLLVGSGATRLAASNSCQVIGTPDQEQLRSRQDRPEKVLSGLDLTPELPGVVDGRVDLA